MTAGNSKLEIRNTKLDGVLALDPSSTVCGYCLMGMDLRMWQHGLITPGKASYGSFERVMGMADDLVTLLEETRPGTVLIEWTKGKVNVRRHGGLGAGLAVYGCGVGGLARAAYVWCQGRGSRMEAILENDWTRGQAKDVRQLAVAQLYPQYVVADDPGGDAADAIGLAVWWLRERRARMQGTLGFMNQGEH